MWFQRKPVIEEVTVVVNEADASYLLKQIDDAFLKLQRERRDLEKVTGEAKTERERLETAIAQARRRGAGRW